MIASGSTFSYMSHGTGALYIVYSNCTREAELFIGSVVDFEPGGTGFESRCSRYHFPGEHTHSDPNWLIW